MTRIHSVCGTLPAGAGLLETRPFRAPHHGVSSAGLVGGGPRPSPGEISLAHRGVLFLDELPEFRRDVLEAIRQPLEERRIAIVRVGGACVYPCDVLLVAAMNPCPCGGSGDPRRLCALRRAGETPLRPQALRTAARSHRSARPAAGRPMERARRGAGRGFRRGPGAGRDRPRARREPPAWSGRLPQRRSDSGGAGPLRAARRRGSAAGTQGGRGARPVGSWTPSRRPGRPHDRRPRGIRPGPRATPGRGGRLSPASGTLPIGPVLTGGGPSVAFVSLERLVGGAACSHAKAVYGAKRVLLRGNEEETR